MIDSVQESIMKIKAAGIMFKDPHAAEDGKYLIRSLYFDDINDSCVWDNLSGKEPRSKFRIRYYGNDTRYLKLEKKTKKRNMTLKESCRISVEDCEAMIKGWVPKIEESFSDTKKKMYLEIQKRGLFPKTIVTYERTPYIYPGGNVRITFDNMLSSSIEVNKFLSGGYITRPIFPLGQSILEVKWDEVMPRHIKETLQLDNLNWTAFSKYYMCRKISLI